MIEIPIWQLILLTFNSFALFIVGLIQLFKEK